MPSGCLLAQWMGIGHSTLSGSRLEAKLYIANGIPLLTMVIFHISCVYG